VVTEELISYIKSQLDSGMEKNEIIRILKSQGGWEDSDIAEAFFKIEPPKVPVVEPSRGVEPLRIDNVLEKPAVTSFQKSSLSVIQPVRSLQKDSLLGNNVLEAQGAHNVAQTKNQIVQEKNNSDSILGQVSKEKKGGSKKIISVVVVVLVLLGLFGAVAYGYNTYFKTPKPIDLLLESAVKGMKVTNARNKSSFNLDLKVETGGGTTSKATTFGNPFPGSKISFGFQVSSDIGFNSLDPLNQKTDGSLSFGLKGSTNGLQVNFDGAADVKMVDNILYLRLRDLTPFMEFDWSEYQNKWIKIDLENVMPGIGFNLEELSAIQTEQEEKNKEALQKIFSNPIVIEIINRSGKVEKVKDEKGNKEYQLTLQISKEDWKTLIKEFLKEYKASYSALLDEKIQEVAGSSDAPSSEEVFAEIEKGIDSEEAGKAFEVLEKLTIQEWINKETMLSRKSVMSWKFEGLTIEDKNSGKVTIDGDLSGENVVDYSAVIEVIPPTDAIPLMDFIKEVTKGSQTQQKVNFLQVQSNLRTVSVQAELYYDDHDQSYGTPVVASSEACNNLKTMFGDDTIKFGDVTIKSEIKSTAGLTPKGMLTCAIGKGGQSWAIDFNDPDDSKKWCVDSTGYVGENSILKTGGKNSIAECGKNNSQDFEELFKNPPSL